MQSLWLLLVQDFEAAQRRCDRGGGLKPRVRYLFNTQNAVSPTSDAASCASTGEVEVWRKAGPGCAAPVAVRLDKPAPLPVTRRQLDVAGLDADGTLLIRGHPRQPLVVVVAVVVVVGGSGGGRRGGGGIEGARCPGVGDCDPL